MYLCPLSMMPCDAFLPTWHNAVLQSAQFEACPPTQSIHKSLFVVGHQSPHCPTNVHPSSRCVCACAQAPGRHVLLLPGAAPRRRLPHPPLCEARGGDEQGTRQGARCPYYTCGALHVWMVSCAPHSCILHVKPCGHCLHACLTST